jgi:hypothetical protein
MKALIQELIPHAPNLGLFVAPHLPADKVRNALRDYATSVSHEEVVALYDATLLGSAKDGAVFASDRFVFQNNNLEPAQVVHYGDLVEVDSERKLFGGPKVNLSVNRGRATIALSLDFSGKPDAAAYVARFLKEAMLRGAAEEMDRPLGAEEGVAAPAHAQTDRGAVRRALDALRTQGQLSDADFARLMEVLERTEGR